MEAKFSSLFINGKFYEGQANERLAVLDKYSGQKIAELSQASDADIEWAIKSTCQGFEVWSRSAAGDRAEMLEKLAHKLEQRAEEFAQLICAEAGKPIALARIEVHRGISVLRLSAVEALRLKGDVWAMDWGKGIGKQAMTRRFAKGAVLAFSPFNFPLNLALHKIAPALASGCSILLKLPPQTPLTMLLFCTLIQECELPAGVVNCIACTNDLALKLVCDPRFSVFSFTGSDAVGWYLKEKAGKKSVVLELGGNAAVIIDKSANLMEAAKQISRSAFNFSGQVCISTQRILVHDAILAEFKKHLISETQMLQSGSPLREDVINGPLISNGAARHLTDLMNQARLQGAKLILGGTYFDEHRAILSPTIFEDVSDTCGIWADEVFGPVVSIQSFSDLQDALISANNSRYGLQAGLFSNDFNSIQAAVSSLRAGTVLINEAPGFRMDHLPYGGLKDSGMGKEGVCSAIVEMTEERVIIW
jgi:acyl-CoA reductase-like NAD-dependent aldehyde dehydrogenase